MRVIVNPSAGKGAGRRCLSELRSALSQIWPGHYLVQTGASGEAESLARESALQGDPMLISVGGDGTVSEVVNGLAGSSTALGIVAVGTGNDVARTLGLPLKRPLAALDVIRQGARKKIDLGWDGSRYFVSILGIGFPAVVAAEASRQRHFAGPLAFGFSVYRRITEMTAARAVIKVDKDTRELECTSILVQNTPFTGGGLRMVPDAKVDDGWLDVVTVDNIGRINLLWNFPKLYRGTHLANSHFKVLRCRRLGVQTEPSLAMTLDGEPYGLSPIEISVAPAAVTVLVKQGTCEL